MAKQGSVIPTKLDYYIKAAGSALPAGSWIYESSRGSRGHLCLFCDNAHDKIEVFKFIYARKKLLTTSTFCCSSCSQLILDHLPEFAVALAERSNDDKTTSSEAIQNFVKTLTLPTAKHRHYLHLDQAIEIFSVCSNNCIFCRKITTTTKSTIIIDPVGMPEDTSYLGGGTVLACEECAGKLFDILGHPVDELYKAYCAVDTCYKCGVEYYISKVELDCRKHNGSMGQHYCPHDTYHLGHSTDEFFSDELSIMNLFRARASYGSTLDGTGQYDRYGTCNCRCCDAYIEIDKTRSPEKTFIALTDINGEGAFCQDCLQENGTAPFAFCKTANVSVRIYKEGPGKNCYNVISTDRRGKIIEHYVGLTRENALDYLME